MNESTIAQGRIEQAGAMERLRQAYIREARYLKNLGLRNKSIGTTMGLKESSVRKLLHLKGNISE